MAKTTEPTEPPRPASFFTFGEADELPLREIVSAEAVFPGDAPFTAVDAKLQHRRKPVPLRLIQNPLINYELAMAEHAALLADYERQREDWLLATELAQKQTRAGLLLAWQKCHGQWGAAHWYALEEFLSEGRTVGLSAFYLEGLHRQGRLALFR